MTNHEAWLSWLEEEKGKGYFKKIESELARIGRDYLIWPEPADRFRALDFENIDNIKVILVGTRPISPAYCADGLSWSSLDQIDRKMGRLYRKIYEDLGVIYDQGDNTKDRWVKQGILPLNMELTTHGGESRTLWTDFTSAVLRYFFNLDRPIVFLFFDSITPWIYWQSWNKKGHPVIQWDIAEGRTFQPIFSRVNNYLRKTYSTEIDWS